MAKVDISITKTEKPNVISSGFSFTTAAKDDEIVIPYDGKDHQIYIVVTATAATTLTVKAGNGLQGVTDRYFALEAGKHHFFTLDSGYHKNVSGENKGNVVLIAGGACSIAAVEARV